MCDGEELLEAVDHPLRPAQAEGRDDDLALEPGGPGDDRVELLDQPVVGVELAVAVGALGDEDVDVLDDVGSGSSPMLRRPRSPVKTNRVGRPFFVKSSWTIAEPRMWPASR